MVTTTRHKAFVSFHEKDRRYRQFFASEMRSDFVDRSVMPGDINEDLKVETIRAKIRDEFIADATVTVVLIGACTWQRKYVDWEIGSSLRATKNNPRCGLIGVMLPTHPNFGSEKYSKNLVPPRLADNTIGRNPYARIYDWPNPWDPNQVRDWIHAAFLRRDTIDPDISRPMFRRNRSGPCATGWTD